MLSSLANLLGLMGMRSKIGSECRLPVLAMAVLALSGCGILYTSPSVREREADTPVTVIELTPATAAEANASPYKPLSLPEMLYTIAGEEGVGGSEAFPTAPFIPGEPFNKPNFRNLPDVRQSLYRIGIGDVLLLATRARAETVEQLSGLLEVQSQRRGYTVRDDGAIAIPEVGPVQLAGMTVEEAENALFQVLVENQIDPSFSLEVAEFNSQRVTVGGAVNEPNLIPITLNPLTLGDALTKAGGLNVTEEKFASIRIYRDGELYEIPVDRFLADDSVQTKLLLHGDAVYVETDYDIDRALEYYDQELDVISRRNSAQKSSLDELQARIALGAADRDYVYLTGEVKLQNRLPLPYRRKATLADVLYQGGGFSTATGDASEIYLLRANSLSLETGEITAYHLDATNVANLVTATRMEMRPNDIVFIEEQPITKWGRALQQFFPTLLNVARDVARDSVR